MFNEQILVNMAVYGGLVWTGVDRLKPTIKHLFANVPKFNTQYQDKVFIVIAWFIALALVGGDASTRVFELIGRAPANTVWEVIDLVLTASLVVAGDEATHRIVDFFRLYFGAKADPNAPTG